MRLRNWLLTGTSLGLMAVLPLTVRAQDGDIVAAYQAYQAAQASGDQAALDEAQNALTEACIVAGYSSIDECIAAISAPAEEAAPVEEEAPAEEAAPVEEPIIDEAPAEEPVAEPAPEADFEVEAEAAPEPEAAPAEEEVFVEEPAPEAEEPIADEPVVEEPVAEEPVFTEEPAPVEEEPVFTEEPAPAQEEPEFTEQAEEPVADEPVAEEPVFTEEPAPVEEAPAVGVDIGSELQAQIDIYNGAVADILSGGDTATAQANISQAQAEIEALCAGAGFSDVDSCLAEYGLSLPNVPNLPAGELTEEPVIDAPADELTEEPVLDTPVEELPAEPVEVIEELPEGVTEEQIAPVLDSAKDFDVDPAAEGELEAEVEAEPVVAPPESDSAAQSDEIRALAAEPLAIDEQGTEVTATENNTVTQTVVNNYVNNITNINNTTNNTTVNTGDVTNNTTNIEQNNIGQQNNVTVVEQAPVQASNTGDVITQVILQVGSQLIVNSVGQDTDRFYNPDEDEIFYENLSNGRTREVITRPDGSQIITVRNRNGDVLNRTRVDANGREYVLANFDDQYYEDLVVWRDPGQDLPPLRLNIPVQEYVLDAAQADEDEIETFFAQPPVEQVSRLYSIDEVKRSARVRDSVRRLEVGGLTFDTGAATIARDQVGALSSVANGMLALLAQNPSETFLIEGHTDAVGSDVSNLRLSDLRAATVARILTDFYDIPPENLATQGYGERYLKIRTEAGERENRRVTIRRITPLITVSSN